MNKKLSEYLNISKISKRLTDNNYKIRRDSIPPRFKSLIEELDNQIESMLQNFELNEIQKKQERLMRLNKKQLNNLFRKIYKYFKHC